MRNSKILIITNHSYMLWRFRRELIEALMEEHEVVLSMPFVGHEEDFMNLGIRCIKTDIDRRGMNPLTDVRLMRSYDRLLKAEKPDLVITYSIKPNIYAGLMCEKNGIPFCANVQGLGTAFQKPGLSQFVTLLYKRALKKSRVVFFENTESAAEFQRRSIIPKEKEVVLHGAGINLEEYAYQPYPENECVHFLYLGRIMREKGMDELFQATRRLQEEGESFFLDLVGFFEDEYKQQVEELEQAGIARFHGFQKEPRPYYEVTDCVVLPSYHEGMSNVLLEAAATGRPVITSDIPGCREAVEDGLSGFLVTVQDSDSLYRAMKQIIHMPRAERVLMGQKGREKMLREFRKEDVLSETMGAIYAEEANL